MCLTEDTRQALQLDETHQLRVFLLEILRYLRRGSCDYPDAGAAYIQLKRLTEHQCLYWNGTHYEVDLAAVKPALTALASAMTCSVLQGDTGKAEGFLQRYSPHHQREETAMLLNRLGNTVDMIEYDQKIKGFNIMMEFSNGFILRLSLCLDIGIANIAMITLAMQRGYFHGFWLGIGTCVGDLAYALLALAGMAVLLQYEVVRWVLWIGGEALLLWFAGKMLVAAYQRQQNLISANLIRLSSSCGSSGGVLC